MLRHNPKQVVKKWISYGRLGRNGFWHGGPDDSSLKTYQNSTNAMNFTQKDDEVRTILADHRFE